MKIADILLEDFDMEMAMTRRILAAVPEDRQRKTRCSNQIRWKQ